ncbi:hypothetical protein BHE74_00017261 [Ensete ventricosum]|nr:hypothetical protein BHE74_00017261 [Ensete ventricosum]
MTSSTRRDHWLTLIKEVILLHHFTSKFNIEHPVHVWEIHARTILGVLRLHAARELLRISPPAPANFLIFSLYEDLPKGDYVLAELANAVKQATGLSPCTATSILKGLNISHGVSLSNTSEDETSSQADTLKSLETTIDQVREEVKEVSVAKATVEEMKEEGISDSLLTLVVSCFEHCVCVCVCVHFHSWKFLLELKSITAIDVCVSKQQANVVMWAMIGIAVLLVAVPFKYILMWLLLCFFIADSKIAKRMSSEQGNRRLREWWESIPIIPVRTISSRP